MVQVGIIPYAGVDIATFEILMESLTAQYSEEQIPAPLIVGAGMLSSCFAQCVSYPLALTRTRLQVWMGQREADRHPGLYPVHQQISKCEMG